MSNEQLFYKIYKAVLSVGATHNEALHQAKRASRLLKSGKTAQQAIDHCVEMVTRPQLRPV